MTSVHGPLAIFLRCAFLTATLVASCSFAGTPVSPKASVVVLSTLHQLHRQVSAYGFDVLQNLLYKLNPDILAVELRSDDLTTRRDQSIKQEYQESVFPFLKTFSGSVVTLEPEEPMYSQWVAAKRAALKALQVTSPQKDDAIAIFDDELYKYLLAKWTSPCDVNSAETDSLFEVSHRYQFAVYDPAFREFWEKWNQYALEKILAAARANPGKRIVVLMGAEHGYWLRHHLRQTTYVQLEPNCAFN
jgi:hypothetical protein